MTRLLNTVNLPVLDLGDHGSWVLPVFFLALVIRAAYAMVAPGVDPFLIGDPLHGDAASYDRLARSLINGTGYSQFPPKPGVLYPPGYPFILSIIYSLAGYYPMLARIILSSMSALLVPIGYLLIVPILGKDVAKLTSLGLTVYPHHIYFGAWLIPDGLYVAMLFGLLFWVRRATESGGIVSNLLIGVGFSVAALTKPVTLLIVPFVGLWMVRRQWTSNARKGVVSATLVLLGLFIGLAPWTVRNYQKLGGFILISTNGGYVFYGANNEKAFGGQYENFPRRIEGMGPAEQEREYFRRGLSWIQSNPTDYANLLTKKYGRLLSPLSVASSPNDYDLPLAWMVKTIYACFLGFSALGIIVAIRGASRQESFLLLTPIAGVLLSVGIFYGDARFSLPAFPSLVAFASIPANKLLRSLITSRAKAW